MQEENSVQTPDHRRYNMRVYIAGPMRGLPLLNFPEFFRIEAEWRARGWDVVK